LRKRQRETIENCPSNISPLYNEISYVNDTDIYKKHKFSLKYKIIDAIKKFIPLINLKKINDKHLEAELVYMWGAFPLNTQRQFIVELDNPYVLAFYKPRYFRILKPLIKKMLLSDKCKKIVCISDACQNNLKLELGHAIYKKSTVVYPFMKSQPEKIKNVGKKLLFISTQFELKGGREVLEAFKLALNTDPYIELTIISNTPKKIIDDNQNIRNLNFFEANIDKNMLHENIYPTHNVFILPTYQDSFGLVYLEALSHGMPIIATNNYAIREMVLDGKNGHLLEAPICYYEQDDKPNMALWDTDVSEYIHNMEINNLYVLKIHDAILNCIENQEKYSKASSNLYNQKFSEKTRSLSFNNAIKN